MALKKGIKPVIAITDFQLKKLRGGGQRVAKLLAERLSKHYKVIYVGHLTDVKCGASVDPHAVSSLEEAKRLDKLKSNQVLESNLLKRIIRYAFHRFRILRNGLLRSGHIDCDIVISNSNYDDIIMLPDSKFRVNYKAAMFIKHNPYHDFSKLYPDRLLQGKAYKIIALNSVDYALLSRKYSKKNVRLIPPILDFHTVHVGANAIKKFGIKESDVLILSLGRLDETQKKLTIAIEAVYNALKEEKNLLYLIAGEGQDKRIYEKLISKLGLKDRVKLIGFISDAEKHALLKRAGMLLQPSLRENFSSVTLEALRSGTIVLTSKNNGSVDIIKNGKNGLFIDLKTEDIRLKVLKIARASKAEKERIKLVAIRTGNAFSSRSMIKDYVSVIEELCRRIK